MIDHTVVGRMGTINGKFKAEWYKLYYEEFPPPDGFDRFPDVAKSDETKKEWEDWWKHGNVNRHM